DDAVFNQTKNLKETVWSRAGSLGNAIKSLIFYLWDVYSSSAPSGTDVLTLLSICSACAIVTGGLLYHWLCKTLKYSFEASVQISCCYSLALLLMSFLCHPLRCMLTMMLPIVSSNQGRKLLISASILILMLNVIPNITVNIGAVARILKCTAEGFAKTLLNSSELFNKAKQDLVDETIKVEWEDLNIVNNLKTLNNFTHVDVSLVKSKFAKVVGEIEEKFSGARDLIGEYKLLSNRILAAIFVALLILESARYLKSYLTSVQFDNGYISKELLPNEPCETKRSIRDKTKLGSCLMTNQECTSSFLSLIVVTLYFTAIALIVVLDYVVYYIVQLVMPWVVDFPPTAASISLNYKVSQPTASAVFQFFSVELFLPVFCLIPRVTFLLGCLWLMSYFMVFLEVYAKRLCRKICASFYREQEERRMAYLRRKLQKKMVEKGGDNKGNNEPLLTEVCLLLFFLSNTNCVCRFPPGLTEAVFFLFLVSSFHFLTY
uniref:Osteoclast stimulatory transmembrane protein n=1 Tax=Oryzias sinensis TaxID=183150 RepID=A0A8C7ZY63_9TELE